MLKNIPEPCWEWFPNTHLASQRQQGHLTRTNRNWVKKKKNSVRRQSFTNKIKMKNCWLQLNKNGIFLEQSISQFSCTSILSKGTPSNSKQKVSLPSSILKVDQKLRRDIFNFKSRAKVEKRTPPPPPQQSSTLTLHHFIKYGSLVNNRKPEMLTYVPNKTPTVQANFPPASLTSKF